MKKTQHPFFDKPLQSGHSSILGKRFRWPPFSVLDARSGEWQDRKRQWLSLGIQSELGRGEALTWQGPPGEDLDYYRHKERDEGVNRPLATTYHIDANDYRRKASPGGSLMPSMQYGADGARGDGKGRPIYHAQPGGGPTKKSVWLDSRTNTPVGGGGAINAFTKTGLMTKQTASLKNGLAYGTTISPYQGSEGDAASQTGTSIFDPVLCEMFYRWFSPLNGLVLDPFAGGSVRGVTASVLHRRYIGIDLRPEQIDANYWQSENICHPDNYPVWLEGDSRDTIEILEDYKKNLWADFVFSCPPYFDLERYSGDKRDLSNTSWKEFRRAYTDIIVQSVECLRNNRFAAFVIGDVRDKDGFYRDLQSLTTEAFEKAGCRLYNEAVLITAVGSLPLRVQKQLVATRKLGREHQTILVFAKGDPRKATRRMETKDQLPNDLALLNPNFVPPSYL